MQDFDALKKIWEHDSPALSVAPNPGKLSRTSQRNRRFLQNAQLVGGIGQIVTGCFILWMIFYGNFGFKFWYTHLSMAVIALLCFFQAYLMLIMYKEIRKINDTARPAEHLQQWEHYYGIRKAQLVYQAPVFTALLSVALGVYYIEILSGRPFLPSLIVVLITIAWVLFAYFYLGKKSIKKELARLHSIMEELRSVERQFRREDA